MLARNERSLGVVPAVTTVFNTLRTGAGGYLTGMDIALDAGGLTSTKVVRTDTYGAYWFNPSVPNPGNAGGTGAWQQVVTTISMPNGYNGPDTHFGVYEFRIAPNNTSHFYMIYNGFLFSSADKGANWSVTNFAQDNSIVDANDQSTPGRLAGAFMAVDPANENVVVVGSKSNKVQYSTDGGSTLTTLSALAAPSGGGNIIAFDPASSVSGSGATARTQGVYIGVPATGIYHSTTGIAGTFTLTTGGPTTFYRIIVAPDGTVWSADTSGALRKFSGGTWSTVNVNSEFIQCIAVDPTNASHLFAFVPGGKGYASADGGATWFGPANGTGTGFNTVATDIPWLGEAFFSFGNVLIDPASTGRLWISEGIAVWYVDYPAISGANWNFGNILTANSSTAAIEQLVSNLAVSPWVAGSHPILVSWDRAFFTVTNPDVYPSTYFPTPTFRRGNGADWASNNPSFIIGITDNQGVVVLWTSSDKGLTWASTSGTGAPINNGGSCAAASSTNFVWVPSDNGFPVYTTDGGATWTQIKPSGVPTSGALGWDNQSGLFNKIVIAADRVNVGTFYMYNYLSTQEGMYVSTDGGATWTQKVHGLLTPIINNGNTTIVKSVPGQAGHCFFLAQAGSAITGGPNNIPLYRTTDGFTTVSDVSNGSYTVRQVMGFGFGKAAPGQTYPAVYIYGFVNGVCGFWRSIDSCATWQKIGPIAPLNTLDYIRFVEGDANTYGTVYFGFGGSGFGYGKLQ